MRKFKNVLVGIIIATMSIFLFTGSSCDNGTDPKPKENGSIVGTWQMVTIKMHDTPIGEMTIPAAQFLGMSETGAKASVLQFTVDGSASVLTTYADDSQDSIPGTWTSEGDKLTVEGAGIDDTVTFKVDGDTMTITRVMAINFVPDTPKEDITIDFIYNRIE